MGTYLATVGWWNLMGSIFMLTFLWRDLGHKVLVEWTQILKPKFELNFYNKLWLFWAAGLNILFGLLNIMAAHWAFAELMYFMLYADIIAYVIFILLISWGLVAGNCGRGIYTAFLIFVIWLGWAIFVLL